MKHQDKTGGTSVVVSQSEVGQGENRKLLFYLAQYFNDALHELFMWVYISFINQIKVSNQ